MAGKIGQAEIGSRLVKRYARHLVLLVQVICCPPGGQRRYTQGFMWQSPHMIQSPTKPDPIHYTRSWNSGQKHSIVSLCLSRTGLAGQLFAPLDMSYKAEHSPARPDDCMQRSAAVPDDA